MDRDSTQLLPNQNSLLSSWGLCPLFEDKRLPADSLNVNLLEWKTQATVPVQAPTFIGPTTYQLVSLRNVKAADETVSGGSKTRVLVLRLSDGSTTHSAIEMEPFLPVDQLMIGSKIEVRRATVIGPYMLLEKAHTTVKGGYIYDEPVVASATVAAGIVSRMYTPLQKGPPAYVSWEQRRKTPKTVKQADQRQLVGELMLGSQAALAAPSRNITLEGKTIVAAKVSSDKIAQAVPKARKQRKQPDATFWDDAPPERGPQDRASPLTFLSMLPQEILDAVGPIDGPEAPTDYCGRGAADPVRRGRGGHRGGRGGGRAGHDDGNQDGSTRHQGRGGHRGGRGGYDDNKDGSTRYQGRGGKGGHANSNQDQDKDNKGGKRGRSSRQTRGGTSKGNVTKEDQ